MKLNVIVKACEAFKKGDTTVKEFGEIVYNEITAGKFDTKSANTFADMLLSKPKIVKVVFFEDDQGGSGTRYRVWRDDSPGDMFSLIVVPSDVGAAAVKKFITDLCNSNPPLFEERNLLSEEDYENTGD